MVPVFQRQILLLLGRVSLNACGRYTGIRIGLFLCIINVSRRIKRLFAFKIVQLPLEFPFVLALAQDRMNTNSAPEAYPTAETVLTNWLVRVGANKCMVRNSNLQMAPLLGNAPPEHDLKRLELNFSTAL